MAGPLRTERAVPQPELPSSGASRTPCSDTRRLAVQSAFALPIPYSQRERKVSFEQQLDKVKTKPGFIAALDQSGGSTPKALGLYGVTEDAWSNDDEMFAVVHEMRTRIMVSPAFNGNLTRRDLKADTAYNTYTRRGLPPTPIAMPGRDAIYAALHPEPGDELYFVATGLEDGSHKFSATKLEHDAAVAEYLQRLRNKRSKGM